MSEPIKTKICSKCKQILPLSEFYKDITSKSGHSYSCKSCRIKTRKKYENTTKGMMTIYKNRRSIANINAHKNYRNSPKGKEYSNRQSKKYKLNNKEKIKSHSAINYHIKMGRISKASILKCFYCNNQAKDYHHWHGYDKNHIYDVIPVCAKCHKHIHTALVLQSSLVNINY